MVVQEAQAEPVLPVLVACQAWAELEQVVPEVCQLVYPLRCNRCYSKTHR